MVKVLLLSHIFPPAVDGGSRVVHQLGQYFASQNFDTIYLSSDCSSTDDFVKSNYRPSRQLTSQIKLPVYHRLRRPLKLINLFLPQKTYLHGLLSVFQKGPVFRFFPFLKSIFTVLKFKPDYIVAGPLPTTIIWYAHIFKHLLKKLSRHQVKILINASFHVSDPDFHQLPLIRSLRHSDYIWTLSQFETDYFIHHLHLPPKKIILAGTGVNSGFIKKTTTPNRLKPNQPINLLFIGSISAHKGLDTLIDSFSYLISQKNSPHFRLIIAGQKTLYYPIIKQKISSLPKPFSTKIKFIFDFPQSRLKYLIDNSYTLILPSRHESFGLVIIEAWARGKPVITSNIATLSELVSRAKGGLTFKLNNHLDLSSQIIKLVSSPQTAFKLGQNGKKYVKNNYLWTKVGQKICQKLLS
jgi:glycosyltransferase involved in cell wall biosynthesis